MGSLDKAFLTGFFCRLCARINKVVVHAFGERGMEINLADQLSSCLGIDVYLADNLPKTVCPSCIGKLKVYYEWRQLVLKAQVKLPKEKSQARKGVNVDCQIILSEYSQHDGSEEDLDYFN